MPPLTRARAAAEAPTLLDALARAPAAAALVVAALKRAKDRKALRLAHPQLRDAVCEATRRLTVDLRAAAAARPPTPRRWPRLEDLTICWPDLAVIEALGSGTWGRLRNLCLSNQTHGAASAADAPALAAALRQMPALRALHLWRMAIQDASALELFCAAASDIRSLTLNGAALSPGTARALAATGWRLEELHLRMNPDLGAAGVAALLAAPTFAVRRLILGDSNLDAAALLALANAPWPLEQLYICSSNFSAAAAGPALAALSQHARLRELDISNCSLHAAGKITEVTGTAAPARAPSNARPPAPPAR